MTVYPLGDQRLMIERNLALLQVGSELAEPSHLGRFVATYEAENNSVDLREHLTVYRKGK